MMSKYKVDVGINGDMYRFLNGGYHCEIRPAVEYLDGYKAWYFNGKVHREGGPAVEWADDSKQWWLNGKLHREDGPAIERADGTGEWWLEGAAFTREKFEDIRGL